MSNTREANLFNSPQIHLNLIESLYQTDDEMMRLCFGEVKSSQVVVGKKKRPNLRSTPLDGKQGGDRENGSGGKCSRKGEYCWRGFENEDCASGRRNRGTKECNQEDLIAIRDAADAAISHLAMTDCVVLILCIHDVLE